MNFYKVTMTMPPRQGRKRTRKIVTYTRARDIVKAAEIAGKHARHDAKSLMIERCCEAEYIRHARGTI